MKLNAPRAITFYVAVALMLFGIIAYFTSVIELNPDTAVLSLAGGGVLLALSNMLKGL